MPRLLIVDDEDGICEVIAAYCTEQGYAVTTVSDGLSAREALQRESFDALIVDVLLPKLSGLALAESASARRIPVLLMSGEPDTIERLNGNSRWFLQKPFHLEELGTALRTLIKDGAPIPGLRV